MVNAGSRRAGGRATTIRWIPLEAAVRHVIATHSTLVKALTQTRSHRDLAGGQIFAFLPDATLSGGAASLESGGYFNDDNLPPWEPWIAIRVEYADISFGRRLYSYVPAYQIESANAGVAVNPGKCIWLLEPVDVDALLSG